MSRKEKVVRPFEYCLDKAKLALEDKLIPELRQEIIHSELSPDKAWRGARRRLNNKDEALSRSYWWLAKTKRDYREEFQKKVSPPSPSGYGEAREEKEMGEKVKIEVEVDRDSLIQVLEEKFGLDPFIDVLEKKGLKVKICENCKDFSTGWCVRNEKAYGKPSPIQNWCDHDGGWVPKEVSGKPPKPPPAQPKTGIKGL